MAVLPWLLIAAGVYYILLSSSDLRKARQVATWPTVQGWLVRADIGTQSFGREGRIIDTLHYQYAIGDVMHDGCRLSFQRFPDVRSAELAIHRLREQKQVVVYYDPADPTQSVLLPGAGNLPRITLALGIALLLGGISVLAFVAA